MCLSQWTRTEYGSGREVVVGGGGQKESKSCDMHSRAQGRLHYFKLFVRMDRCVLQSSWSHRVGAQHGTLCSG